MNVIKDVVRIWLPFAVVATAFCGLVYSTVQQVQRHNADDPQIQMAEDAAAALNRGENVTDVVPKTSVEISQSLAPFMVIYGADGKPIASSGLLNGQIPNYPLSALNSSKASGENRVTWQPTNEVRVASVVAPYHDGFVMAGRNLREVEKRENQTEIFAAVTWLLTLAATFVVILFGQLFMTGKKSAL